MRLALLRDLRVQARAEAYLGPAAAKAWLQSTMVSWPPEVGDLPHILASSASSPAAAAGTGAASPGRTAASPGRSGGALPRSGALPPVQHPGHGGGPAALPSGVPLPPALEQALLRIRVLGVDGGGGSGGGSGSGSSGGGGAAPLPSAGWSLDSFTEGGLSGPVTQALQALQSPLTHRTGGVPGECYPVHTLHCLRGRAWCVCVYMCVHVC
jgi:hypothetical protein